MQKIKNLLFTLPLLFTGCVEEVEENSICGDGIIEGKEECDGEENCNEFCYLDRYIFLTEKSYNGNFGGIGMVDHACTTESKEFGNTDPTRFRAIIGTDESSPLKRLKNHKARIITLRGDVVAYEGLDDLFDGELEARIDQTPFEIEVIDYVLTGINQFGNSLLNKNCDNWTSTIGFPAVGRSDALNGDAIHYTGGYTPTCFEPLRLYCIDTKGGPIV